MLTLLELSISFAGAFIMSAESFMKKDPHVDAELELLIGGPGEERPRAVIGGRHDSRVGTVALAVGFVIQIISVLARGADGSYFPVETLAGIGLGLLLVFIWYLTRKRTVEHAVDQWRQRRWPSRRRRAPSSRSIAPGK